MMSSSSFSGAVKPLKNCHDLSGLKCHKSLVKLRRTSRSGRGYNNNLCFYFGLPVRLLLLVLLGFIGVAGHAGHLKTPSPSHPDASDRLLPSSQDIAFHAEKLLEKSNISSLPKSSLATSPRSRQEENSSIPLQQLKSTTTNPRSFKGARKTNKSKPTRNIPQEAIRQPSSAPPSPSKSTKPQPTQKSRHHSQQQNHHQHQHHSEPLEVSHRLENDFKNSKSVPVVPIQLPPPNETIHYHYTDDDDSEFDFVTTKDYAKLRFPSSSSNFDFFELDNNQDNDDYSMYNSNDNHRSVKGKSNSDFENNNSGKDDDEGDFNDNKNNGRSRASISKKSKSKSKNRQSQHDQDEEHHHHKFKDLTDIQLELESSSSDTFPRFYQKENNDHHFTQRGKWSDEDHGMSYNDYYDGHRQNSHQHEEEDNNHNRYYNFKKNELSVGPSGQRRDQSDSVTTNVDQNDRDYYDGDFKDFRMKSGMMEFESKRIVSSNNIKKDESPSGGKKGSDGSSQNKKDISDRDSKNNHNSNSSKKKSSSLSLNSRNNSSNSVSGGGSRGRGSNSLEEGLSFEYDGPSEEGGLMRRRPRRSVVHLYDMVVCATGCNPLAYKGYGCYCGFLGSGLTVDGIDRCCAKHDWCYHHAKCPPLLTYFVPYYWTCNDGRPKCVTDYRGWKGICGANLCECDRQFAECLRKFPCPRSRAMCMTSPWRFWQNLLMTPPMRYGYEY